MQKFLTQLRQSFRSLTVKIKLIQGRIETFTTAFFLLMSIVTLGVVVYQFGYITSAIELGKLKYFHLIVLLLYFVRFVYRSFFLRNQKLSKRYFWINIVVSLLLFIFLYNYSVDENRQIFFSAFKHPLWVYAFIALFAGFDLSAFAITIFRKAFNPSQLFALSFFLIISVGTGLLMLPNASHHGIQFMDAVFVSTSAVCVTGLTPINVSIELTSFGQLILIGLIQVGGLGVMTFTSFISIFFMQKPSYESQFVIKGLLHQEYYVNIFSTLRNIIFTTFGIELIGTILIYQSVGGSSLDDFWFSAFHSISAFCNAGFSILSGNLYDLQVRTNYLLHFWIALLIIVGGLGFPIIFNYARYLYYKFHNALFILFRKKDKIKYLPNIINLNTRIVLITTGALLLFGTVFFFIFEYSNTMSHLNFGEKIMSSFFFSTSARTAGFNTLPMNSILPTSAFLLMFLMWVGASPSSTGGGIKTTTFALALLNTVNILRGREHIEVGKRQVSNHSIRKAFSIIIMSIFLIAIATLLLSLLEPEVSLTRLLVEVISAIGTVGFSMDLTATLSDASKCILAVVMFIGRIGMITFLLMFAKQYTPTNYTYPKENVFL